MNLAQPGPVAMGDLMTAAAVPGGPVRPDPAALPLVHLLTGLADALIGPLPAATPEGLIAEARAAGWQSGVEQARGAPMTPGKRALDLILATLLSGLLILPLLAVMLVMLLREGRADPVSVGTDADA